MKETLSYTEAIGRLEAIVGKIDNGQLDIDSLSAQLKEAKALVAFCKERLTKVEKEVNENIFSE